jgi:hypothetical protein
MVVLHFEECLMESTDDGVMCMTELVCALIIQHLFSPHIYIKIQKSVSCARSDDTKGIKGAVLDWITPQNAPLNPPLACNIKMSRATTTPPQGYSCAPLASIRMILGMSHLLPAYMACKGNYQEP